MGKAVKATSSAIAPRVTYSAALADEICKRISNGVSLRTICAAEGFPDRASVSRWLAEHEDFATKYACARDAQADEYFDRMQDVAEQHEDVNRAKLIVGTLQWRASKLAPKKYGDRIEVGGSLGMPGLQEAAKATGDLNAMLAGLAALGAK